MNRKQVLTPVRSGLSLLGTFLNQGFNQDCHLCTWHEPPSSIILFWPPGYVIFRKVVFQWYLLVYNPMKCGYISYKPRKTWRYPHQLSDSELTTFYKMCVLQHLRQVRGGFLWKLRGKAIHPLVNHSPYENCHHLGVIPHFQPGGVFLSQFSLAKTWRSQQTINDQQITFF